MQSSPIAESVLVQAADDACPIDVHSHCSHEVPDGTHHALDNSSRDLDQIDGSPAGAHSAVDGFAYGIDDSTPDSIARLSRFNFSRVLRRCYCVGTDFHFGSVAAVALRCGIGLGSRIAGDFRCWYVERMPFCSGAPNAGCEKAADASSCLQFIADAFCFVGGFGLRPYSCWAPLLLQMMMFSAGVGSLLLLGALLEPFTAGDFLGAIKLKIKLGGCWPRGCWDESDVPGSAHGCWALLLGAAKLPLLRLAGRELIGCCRGWGVNSGAFLC
ncbi:hypothetical protein Nepgr_009365 [Nepenthes gracilis]|uniref:Uncharacterized protein n=1 Tax=Nepenthes gracilis TaxID=150966 RepID=A0AAD3SAW7_NEPGR|nr:hypothetical protein Nepgr_009365 [Nepenthes gracilis]